MSEINKPSLNRKYKYYAILGIAKIASQEQIKQAYLKLARTYHPDVNPDPTANERFKEINQAYQVLSDPSKRTDYDNSPAECPVCWTYEVVQTAEVYWRCRHCGCRFDPTRTEGIIERVENAQIPETERYILRLFNTCQCSWCKNFYTQPFLCPHGKLHSHCFFFDRLSQESRQAQVENDKWWWRMYDMTLNVEKYGNLARCRLCGALNPNPEKHSCWQCGEHSLSCPSCEASPLLKYNIADDFWKCSNAGCGKKFAIKPPIQSKGPIPVNIEIICPRCKKISLAYQKETNLWKCRHCASVFNYNGIHNDNISSAENIQGEKRPRDTKAPAKPVTSEKTWTITRAGKLVFYTILIFGIGIIIWICYYLINYRMSN